MERYGKYETKEKLFQCSSFDHVWASESGAGGSARDVSLTILANSRLADNTELVQQLNAFKDFADPGFGRVLEVSVVSEPKRVAIASEWLPGTSLRRLIASDPTVFNPSNMDFALYVLRSLASALSRLHHWRLLDDRTCVHGYLSPDFVWMDQTAQVKIQAPFLGWVAEQENPGHFTEQDDVKALGRMLLSLLGCSGLAGLHRRSGLPPDAVRIVAAADFLRSIRDFAHFVESVTKQGPYVPTTESAKAIIAKLEAQLKPPAPPEPPPAPAVTPPVLIAVPKPPSVERPVSNGKGNGKAAEEARHQEAEKPTEEALLSKVAEPSLHDKPTPVPLPAEKPEKPERPEKPRETPLRTETPVQTLELQEQAKLMSGAANDLIRGELKDCLQKVKTVLAMDPDNASALGLQQEARQKLDEQCGRASELLRSAEFARSEQDRREDCQKAKQLFESVLRVDPDHGTAAEGLQEVQELIEKPLAKRPLLPPPGQRAGMPQFLKIGLLGLIVVAVGVGGWFAFTALKPPAKGTLQLRADEGIEVILQGKSLGTTPLQPVELAPGSYPVVYKFGGQEIANEAIEVQPGKTVENKTQHVLSRFQFQLDPPDMEILVNGVPKADSTPLVVTPGHYAFLFRKAGFEPQALEKQVAAGQVEPLNVKLPPVVVTPTAHGTLAVASRYGLPIEIFEGGVSLGWTPTQLSLAPGNHRLEYRCQGLTQTILHRIESGAAIQYPVVFNVKVDVNSAPWSDVYLLRGAGGAGADQHLGQTPLQGVTVPVGATLAFQFQNPTARKTYKVNAAQKTISMRR